MGMEYEMVEYKGYEIWIYRDEDCEEPEPDNSIVKLVSFHPRYGKRHGFGSPEEVVQFAKREKWNLFPVYAYIHSGIALSLGRGYPFNDPWDSGQYGFLLLKKKEFRRVRKTAEAILESYNQWYAGDCWGYDIIDPGNGESVDSCWGFLGREYVEQEAKNVIEGWVERKTDHTGQLLFFEQ